MSVLIIKVVRWISQPCRVNWIMLILSKYFYCESLFQGFSRYLKEHRQILLFILTDTIPVPWKYGGTKKLKGPNVLGQHGWGFGQ